MRHQSAKTRFSAATAGPISEISRHTHAFLSGEERSRDLTEACLDRILDPKGEGKRTFTKVYADGARTAASAQDTSFGQRLFQDKADCQFCHGPEGDGRGDPRSRARPPRARGPLQSRWRRCGGSLWLSTSRYFPTKVARI